MSALAFADRADAGRQLAALLVPMGLRDPLVLAIPRGGIRVAQPVAHALGAELDVVLARKLRAPRQRELAIGAVGEDGGMHLDPRTAALAMAGTAYVEEERRTQLAEIARRARLFRAVRPRAAISGRDVVVVDDGLATGSTMIAALHTARLEGARLLVAAVPVGSTEALAAIEPLCDRVVCALRPADFWAVGQFYRDFGEVTDDEVAEALREAAPGQVRTTAVG
jgi:hypothetical protein